MMRLDIIYGPERGMSFGLYDHEIIIGRSTDNDIQIRDTSISRHHIKIHLKEEKYFVEDLKSKNGTIVMGRPVRSGQKIELEKGHYIAIGNTVISLEEEILENERERLISELQDALSRVKMLSGMLPICANCKKIRDDKGYWNQIELYIKEHSEAEFSHGICPDCCKKLYPGFTDPDKSTCNSSDVSA